ncbi:MAG TPA: hypothetical protein PLF42_08375 [Anaerolineales bacterium]|nr:hypothetical protein [Anaerolineales bacterium]
MRKSPFLIVVLLFLVLAVYGCARPVETDGRTDEQLAAATAAVEENIQALPTDLPIHPDAEKLRFAAGNTYITYEVLGDVDTIVDYYRTELESMGWEKRGNSPETPIGGALTILRVKPDKNVSITVQSIPSSDYVRVLISVILK